MSSNWILVALMIGLFLSPLNVTFTSVALPPMRAYFGISVEQVSWVGTAYFIPTVVLMPLLAGLGRFWGIKWAYTLGLALLSIGAIAVAFVPDFGWLLGSRILQGVGWSALYSLALILIRRHYAIGQHGTVMGTWESAVGLATIVAPTLAGGIIELVGWRGIYVMLGLVAAIDVVVAATSIPDETETEDHAVLDLLGAVALTLALFLALLGITLKAPFVLLIDVIVFALCVWRARRAQDPFFDPAILMNRLFLSASAAAMLRMLILIVYLMSLPLLLEDVFGWSTVLVGGILPIYSLFMFLSARPGGRWSPR